MYAVRFPPPWWKILNLESPRTRENVHFPHMWMVKSTLPIFTNMSHVYIVLVFCVCLTGMFVKMTVEVSNIFLIPERQKLITPLYKLLFACDMHFFCVQGFRQHWISTARNRMSVFLKANKPQLHA